MPSPNNLAIIAAAGSCKTQYIVDSALADTGKRVLITTYTNENLAQLVSRLSGGTGVLPSHITVMSWFSLLLNQCARPYQRAILEEPGLIVGIDFIGARARFTAQSTPVPYFLDRRGNMYRDGVSDFACKVNAATSGMMIQRLEDMFDHIYIDEFQDIVGYDLDLLDLLLRSSIDVTVVGDPRQFTYETNRARRNKKYEGKGIVSWLQQRRDLIRLELRTESYRCNQDICDFADGLYPDLERTVSKNLETTGHDGIFRIAPSEVETYAAQYSPSVLRYQKSADTCGLEAMNIGMAKGLTFDRVLIFPTEPMKAYFKTRDPSKAGAKEKLYVAVTRAKYSATFVIP